MQYATPQDFINQFRVNIAGNAGYPVSQTDQDAARLLIDEALQESTSEMNIYLASFDIPENATPRYLRYACCVIAAKQLDKFVDREKVRADYEDVIRTLRAIAKGELSLPSDSTTTTGGTDSGGEVPIKGVYAICDRAKNTVSITF